MAGHGYKCEADDGLRGGVARRGRCGLADERRRPQPCRVLECAVSVPIVVLAGWSLIGSGLLAWRSRPDSHLGTVLIFTGFAWFASVLPAAHNPVLFTAGEVAGLFRYVGLAYLVLSFRPAVLRAGLTAGWWQRRSCHDGLLAVEIAGNGVGGRGPRDRVGPARACRPGGGAQRPANRVQPPGEGNNVARGVPMRVVVADDAVILREGLAWLLSR